MRPLAIACASLVASCAVGRLYEPKPRQDEAAARIVQSFEPGSTWVAPPVFWHEPETLNCIVLKYPDGTIREFAAHPPEAWGWWDDVGCIGGVHHTPSLFDQTDWIEASWFGGKFSATSMGHEICHAWDMHMGRDGDANHDGACVEHGGIIDVANADIEGYGL